MISSTIRALRNANGFTQKQIADKLNIDRSTYSYYELGKINPSINSLIVLSDLYGITLDEMVHYDASSAFGKAASKPATYETNTVLTDDEKRIISCYRNLSNEEKENILISVINIARDSSN